MPFYANMSQTFDNLPYLCSCALRCYSSSPTVTELGSPVWFSSCPTSNRANCSADEKWQRQSQKDSIQHYTSNVPVESKEAWTE